MSDDHERGTTHTLGKKEQKKMFYVIQSVNTHSIIIFRVVCAKCVTVIKMYCQLLASIINWL